MIITLFVRYSGKDLKYILDTDVSLEVFWLFVLFQQHVQKITQLVGAQGTSSAYGLQIVSTYVFLKPEVRRRSLSSPSFLLHSPLMIDLLTLLTGF